MFGLVVIGVLVAGLTQADEITISTYYPAPYGVYNKFEVKKSIVVGNISDSGISGLADVNDLDAGELWIQDSMIFEPKSSFNPDTAAAGKEGELIYSSADALFYYYDGSAWQSLAGAGFGNGGWVLVDGTSPVHPLTQIGNMGLIPEEEPNTGFTYKYAFLKIGGVLTLWGDCSSVLTCGGRHTVWQ